MTRHPLPSPGSGRNPFPCFAGTLECSDALPPLSPGFLVSPDDTTPCACVRRSHTARRRPGAWGVRDWPPHGQLDFGMEAEGPPRFLGNPDVLMPCSLTPAGSTPQAPYKELTRPPLIARRGLPRCGNFGAPSHGLGTGCLRFAGWVTPIPRKTRFWVLAKLSQAGLVTRRVPMKGFKGVSVTSHPPVLDLSRVRFQRMPSFFGRNAIGSPCPGPCLPAGGEQGGRGRGTGSTRGVASSL